VLNLDNSSCIAWTTFGDSANCRTQPIAWRFLVDFEMVVFRMHRRFFVFLKCTIHGGSKVDVPLIAFLHLWLKFCKGIDKYQIVPVRKLFYFRHWCSPEVPRNPGWRKLPWSMEIWFATPSGESIPIFFNVGLYGQHFVNVLFHDILKNVLGRGTPEYCIWCPRAVLLNLFRFRSPLPLVGAFPMANIWPMWQ